MIRKNYISAPVLMIAVFIIVIVFESLVLKMNTNISTNEILTENSGYEYLTGKIEDSDEYIIVNNTVYKADNLFITLILSNLCSFILPGIFYIKYKSDISFKSLNLRFFNIRYLPFLIFTSFLLVFISLFYNVVLYYADIESGVQFSVGAGTSYEQSIGILLSLVIFPAICEEFVFRGIIMREYGAYGSFSSFFMSSVMFALFNFSLYNFALYFAAGMIFCLSVKATGSVLSSVILHFIYNFYNFYVNEPLLKVMKIEQNSFMFLFILTVCFLIFVILTLSSLENIYYGKAYSKQMETDYRQNKNSIADFVKIFCSPAFLGLIIIFFAYLIIK